jgi:biopolymer transport protein ExbD
MEDPERAKVKSPGIPHDSIDQQLGNWIRFGSIQAAYEARAQKARAENLGRKFKYEPLRYAIKADGKANYIAVKDVIKVFTDQEIFRFNLLTNLETE